MLRRFARLVAPAAAVLVMTGCGEDPFEIPTNPTPPVPTTVLFNGEVTPRGAQTHTFTTTRSGEVRATLQFLEPDGTVQMGFALGTWNGTSCQLVITRTDATANTVILGEVSTLGNLCVYIHDVGNLVQPAGYQIEVRHP